MVVSEANSVTQPDYSKEDGEQNSSPLPTHSSQTSSTQDMDEQDQNLTFGQTQPEPSSNPKESKNLPTGIQNKIVLSTFLPALKIIF